MIIMGKIGFLLLSMVVVLLTSVTSYGKTIVFSTPENDVISGVRYIGFQENSDSVASWVSDK